MSVISGLFFKEMYELFVGTNKTVRNIGVSVERGSIYITGVPYILRGSIILHPVLVEFDPPTPISSLYNGSIWFMLGDDFFLLVAHTFARA